MESSSSNPVNSTPAWSGGSRNNSARSADPMAFFDLIMKSSQAMTTKGSKSFDPVTSTGGSTAASDPYTAPTDDPNLHDGYEDSSSAYAPDVHVREASEADQPADSSLEQEDVAAVAELSQQASDKEEKEDEPDQAALETAAAASQQDQLLGAPDTLAEGDLAEAEPQAAAEKVKAADDKTQALPPGELDTDQPLDTAKASEDASSEQQDPTTEQPVQPLQGKSKESNESAVAVAQDASLAEGTEARPGEEATEVRFQEEGKVKLDSVDQVAEETADAEIKLEAGDSAQEESSDRQQKNASTQRPENKNYKPVDVIEPAAPTAPVASTVAAVAKASEALAAAASSSATSGASSSGSSTPNNTTGVNNLASLLQRGFQRGSLQKAEGSQSPQLDPKQQIRLINRVARAVESTPPGQSIKIRLNPSELGQLKVEIKIENGNMTAKIEAENATTRQVLLENLPQLRERLAESNINVQQFEVELMGQQTPQDGSASTFADQSDGEGGSQSKRRPGLEASGEEESASGKRETVNKDAERDSRNLNVTV